MAKMNSGAARGPAPNWMRFSQKPEGRVSSIPKQESSSSTWMMTMKKMASVYA